MASRELDLTPEQAFRLVTAVGEHGRWIPLTRVSAPATEARAGDLVVARTAGLFVDRMRVVMVAPPRRLVLAKVGPVLLGTATITVTPAGARARVSWTYDARLRGPLPATLTRRVLNPALGAMAALALWRMARWVRRTRPPLHPTDPGRDSGIVHAGPPPPPFVTAGLSAGRQSRSR